MEQSVELQILECTIIVDKEDELFCRQLGLSIVKRGDLRHVSINTQPYYKQYLHRVLLGITAPHQIVDHINNNGLDNRRVNLRVTDKSGNALNMRANKTKKSGLPKGVYKKRDKFRACIQITGVYMNLGTYKTIAEAEAAYNKKQAEYWAKYAR